MSEEFDFSGEDEIVLYGAGEIAQAVLAVSRELGFHDKLVGICVSELVHVKSEIDGIKTWRASDFLPLHPGCLVLIAVRDMYADGIIDNIRRLGIKNYRRITLPDCIPVLESKLKETASQRYSAFINSIDRAKMSDEDYAMFLGKQLKTGVLDFEVNLADHCNLNCQCCNHFSPLAPQTFLDLPQYEKDIARLFSLYPDNKGTLMLLGGEPLLYPFITDAIAITRKYMPDMAVDIVTNGLLLKKMDESFWESCRKNDICLSVTKYPVSFDYDSLIPYAEERNVKIKFSYDSMVNKTTYRLPFIENGNLNSYRNFAKCYHANRCVTLRNGRLYTCPMAANIGLLNRHFEKTLPDEDSNSIDIYAASSAKEIEDFLKTPIPLCRHCDIFGYEYEIPWKTSSGNITEWMEVKMHKLILWGAGSRGRQFCAEFGYDRIEVIVDTDSALQGLDYRGIKIISPEEYFKAYSAYPILVTPRNHVSQIIQRLHENGVYTELDYDKEFKFAEVFMKAFSFSMMAPLKKSGSYAVYGFSLLGIFLYEKIRDMGIKCSLILEDSRAKCLQKNVRNKLGFDFCTMEDAVAKKSVLLLAKNLEGNDEKAAASLKRISFLDLFYEREMFRNPAIGQFKDLHKGKRCFIVATGPSLRMSDLDMLKKNGEICISMNSIFNAFADTTWRPDYYVVSDPMALETDSWMNKMLTMDAKAKFIADISWPFGEVSVKDNMFKWHFIRDTELGAFPEVSEDFSLGSHYGTTITFEGALTLAFYLGCSEIYLLGVDCSAYGKRSAHFKDDFIEGLAYSLTPDCASSYDWNIIAYQSAKQYADSHGIKIYNATRGGMLEVFERVDFDGLFS